MVALLSRGNLSVRLAAGPADVESAQRLRGRAFRRDEGLDADAVDCRCEHALIEREGVLQATFRFQRFASGSDVVTGYSGQVYDLARLAARQGPMIEVGRFCIAPGVQDPDLVRLGWAALTRIVDAEGATFLFGCSSFHGTDATPYADALRLLAARHVAPPDLAPGRRSDDVVTLPVGQIDGAEAQRQMPPLLRTYLLMGGWVSDHLVVDRVMETLHVFTAVEIAKVPENRARALRLLAGD
ncbi:GNAT family N-acyltransferase [Maritimibacter sp. UBA3975]|uniref:GNAT family N-acetyltransferase n=1 Tax=Maritimibacter sp. UBA3975 TaxID=1946833 RepID=UPI000C0AD7B0|nr:GNAT family N-acyltransferase [Maritimibacter sp. UBA3975]MAM62413.1 ornithine-acyl-ACP acyltransferase [Maritimibacter sp.]|tara:strand:- start:39092 stop:39814 length:723 start_codon:yes stop_codon:yes gene_type:complete